MQTIGCDNILDSEKAFDSCGVCGSDGSTCNSTLDVNSDVLSTNQILPLTENITEDIINYKNSEYINDNKVTVDIAERQQHGLARIARDRVVREKDGVRYRSMLVEVPFYVWEESAYSECSVSCGVGKIFLNVRVYLTHKIY